MLKLTKTTLTTSEVERENSEIIRFPESPLLVFEDEAGNEYSVLTNRETYDSVQEIFRMLDDVGISA